MASRRRLPLAVHCWGIFGLALVVGTAVGPARLRVNFSASLPWGLYRLDAGAGARPGDLVLACPPAGFARFAVARHYLLRGSCPGGSRALGKLLLAVAGDRLEVERRGIALAGRPLPGTAALATDGDGRPLPRLAPGARRVGAGEVWLVAAHPRSLDSRYFGPIGVSQLRGRLVPLLVGGGADPAGLAAAIRRARALSGDGAARGTAPTAGSARTGYGTRPPA
jgi:conjugative transfer signal peptidase TraF